MVKPDFTKIWAGSRVSIPAISSPDYVKGFAAYLGPLPPQTDDHDYIMNLQDLRALWLEQELATKTAAATDTTAGIVQLAVAANYPSSSDTDTATPAYVELAVSGASGNYSLNEIITSNTTFSITHVGRAIEINSVSATAHNLPSASTYASGNAISFANINTGIATFNRSGSDTITGGNLAATTSIPINNGENFTLVSDGVSKWYVASSNVGYFGPARSWQAVTRTSGTNYTNSTGREIVLAATIATTSTATILVNGLTIARASDNTGQSASAIQVSIPIGAVYSITVAGSLAFGPFELR